MRALVTVDLEEDLEDFEDDARGWLERLGATADLVYVGPPVARPASDTELAALLDTAVRRQDEEHRARLRQVMARLVAPERAGEVVVARDPGTAAAIVRLALGHDLLVLGTHGRSGLARAWLGSVAERVVRTSPAPVLVLRSPTQEPSGASRALVAVDVAEPEPLLGQAARWAERLGLVADLLAVRAPVPPLALEDAAGLAWERVEQDATRASLDVLRRAADGWPSSALGETRVVVGDPAEVVLAEAARGYAAVIVGTHGRQGVGRLWLGSVAERVVRRSPVPVLVVPTR